MIGEEPAPEWLATRTLLAAFGETEPEAVAHYARFVAEGQGQPTRWEQLKNQVFLGSDSFVESLRRQLPKNRDLREVPQSKRRKRSTNPTCPGGPGSGRVPLAFKPIEEDRGWVSAQAGTPARHHRTAAMFGWRTFAAAGHAARV